MNSTTLFNQINIVPRWIIFTLDLLICLLSLTGSYAIKYNFDFSTLDFVAFSRNALILCVLSAAVFFIFKTYAGIIRYTSAQDSFRILTAVLVTNGIYFFLNLAVVSLGNGTLISSSILVINGLACFLFMVIYRVLVKYFFLYVKNLKLDKKILNYVSIAQTTRQKTSNYIWCRRIWSCH